jgi:hypothetical protein
LSTLIRIRIPIVVLSALVAGGCLDNVSPGGFSGDTSNAGGANSAPSISGAPATAILTGDVYSFTPSVGDSDGDALTFSISNKPGWATFDTSSGRLTGQVLLGHEGVYNAIRIIVSDGVAIASLRDFSITVAQSADGAITLSWAPPTQNSDGSVLTDLAGYNIYFGSSQGNYPNRVGIDNPSISTYIIENLLPDTYYVVATSLNSQGVESAYSNVAVKTVAYN